MHLCYFEASTEALVPVKNLWSCRAYAVGHEIVSKLPLQPLTTHTRSLWYGVHSIEVSVGRNRRQNTETRRQRQMHYLRGQSGSRLGCRASEAASRRGRVLVGVVVVV
jgi:hypothetical protein